MATYKNGLIPDRLLIRRGDFLLTAGTWAKFDDLVARVKRRTGVTLRISTGSTPETRGAGAFRTYDMQVRVKRYWTARGQSRMAAYPGTSSHGGEYKGADALAIDITNYGQIPLNVFFEEGRNAGFQMGYFDGKNGKPYEPWHIIDRDPYRKVAAPAATKPAQPEEEEDDMAFKYKQYVAREKTPEGFYQRALVCLEAHVFVSFVERGDDQALAFMKEYDTGSSIPVTKSMLGALQAEVRRAQPRGDIAVTVATAD